MFVHSEFAIQEACDKSLTNNFLAGVEILDFQQNRDAAAAKKINSWVMKLSQQRKKYYSAW